MPSFLKQTLLENRILGLALRFFILFNPTPFHLDKH